MDLSPLLPHLTDMLYFLGGHIFNPKEIERIYSLHKKIFPNLQNLLSLFPETSAPKSKYNLKLKQNKIHGAEFVLSNLPDEEIILVDFGCGKAHLDIALLYLLNEKHKMGLRHNLIINKLKLFDIVDYSAEIRETLNTILPDNNIVIEYHQVDYLKVDLLTYLDSTTNYYTVASHFDGGLWCKLVTDLAPLSNIHGVIFPCCYSKYQPEIVPWLSSDFKHITKGLPYYLLILIQGNENHQSRISRNLVIFFCILYYHLGIKIDPFRSKILDKWKHDPKDLTLDDILNIQQTLISSNVIKTPIPKNFFTPDLLIKSLETYNRFMFLRKEMKSWIDLCEIAIILDRVQFLRESGKSVQTGRLKQLGCRNYYFTF